MNIKQLTNAIKFIPARKSIMLKGTHGIGKITAPRKPKEDPKATKTSTVTGDLRGGKD